MFTLQHAYKMSNEDDMRPRGYLLQLRGVKSVDEQRAEKAAIARPFDYWIVYYKGPSLFGSEIVTVATGFFRVDATDTASAGSVERDRRGCYLLLEHTMHLSSVFDHYANIFAIPELADVTIHVPMLPTEPMLAVFGRPEPHWYCVYASFKCKDAREPHRWSDVYVYTKEADWLERKKRSPMFVMMRTDDDSKFVGGFESIRDQECTWHMNLCQVVVWDRKRDAETSKRCMQRLREWTVLEPEKHVIDEQLVTAWRGPTYNVPSCQSLGTEYYLRMTNPVGTSIYTPMKNGYNGLRAKVSLSRHLFKFPELEDRLMDKCDDVYSLNRTHLKRLVIFPAALALCDVIPACYVIMWIVNWLPGMRLLRDHETMKVIDKVYTTRRKQLDAREELKVARL